jgi:tight adherence protein B
MGAAASAPVLLLRRRAAARRHAVRCAWPDAVDTLVSAVRAGMALPDALADLGRSGPAPLQPAFTAFGTEYRATGSLAGALDLLQSRLADPVADRVIAAVRMTREFGGPDLGSVLRTLATMLREDSRTRGEIAARQSWTVSAARMAVAAPWLTLAFLSTRGDTARAYATTTGAAVLAFAALMSALAYAAMVRIGRLPADERGVA